jgi:hypothetical protein
LTGLSQANPARPAGSPAPPGGDQNRVQAIATSHAGSPTPQQPKSITAASRLFLTSRFPAATSPWNQTGRPLQVARSAASHSVDGPGERIAAAGLAARHRGRDRERQPRREYGQPSLFLVDLGGVALGAREPDRHVVAEAEGPVVPTTQETLPGDTPLSCGNAAGRYGR